MFSETTVSVSRSRLPDRAGEGPPSPLRGTFLGVPASEGGLLLIGARVEELVEVTSWDALARDMLLPHQLSGNQRRKGELTLPWTI